MEYNMSHIIKAQNSITFMVKWCRPGEAGKVCDWYGGERGYIGRPLALGVTCGLESVLTYR